MIENSLLHREEVQRQFLNIWYNKTFEYYFGDELRHIDDNMNPDPQRRSFVSLDKNGSIIGFISYYFDPVCRLVTSMGAINFTGQDRFTFGKDLMRVIDDIFVKYHMETLEWAVICGNPIEESYDRICKRIGGRILCTRHARATDLAGNILDDKVYEVTRQEYMKSVHHQDVESLVKATDKAN